nr:MAG TPA: hypothetical protein [Bacteriophage sp.]
MAWVITFSFPAIHQVTTQTFTLRLSKLFFYKILLLLLM